MGTLAQVRPNGLLVGKKNTPVMAYVYIILELLPKDGKDGFLMIGYDDIYFPLNIYMRNVWDIGSMMVSNDF
ncbi:hypothetical protein NXW94_30605 [Bacteroides ovatus]|nr:hypothetical protein [Bacteroides ovatus]